MAVTHIVNQILLLITKTISAHPMIAQEMKVTNLNLTPLMLLGNMGNYHWDLPVLESGLFPGSRLFYSAGLFDSGDF